MTRTSLPLRRPPDQALNVKDAGIEFIDENGGGPGVRLKKPHKKRT